MQIQLDELEQDSWEATLKDLPETSFGMNIIPVGYGETSEEAVTQLFWKVVSDPRWIPFIRIDSLNVSWNRLEPDEEEG